VTVIVPPHFEMPSDVDYLRVSVPYSVNIVSECLNNGFKSIHAWYEISTECYNSETLVLVWKKNLV